MKKQSIYFLVIIILLVQTSCQQNNEEEQEREITRLRSENSALLEYKKKAHRELCRVRDEQKIFGKIHVKTEL